MTIKILNKFIINILCKIKIFEISYYLLGILHSNKYIRVINFHCTPESEIEEFKKQINFLKKYYISINGEILDSFFKGEYYYSKPGIIYTFDDGLSCNFKAVEELNKIGSYAWLMVPAAIIECSNEIDFMKCERIVCTSLNSSKCQKKFFLSSNQLIDLISKGNEVVSHGFNHKRLSANKTLNELNEEIILSKKYLEEKLKSKINSFAWVGGEWNSYGHSAAKLIKQANYKYVFSTNAGITNICTNNLNIGRINIEAKFGVNFLKVKLSGLVDLKYFIKRILVDRKLK